MVLLEGGERKVEGVACSCPVHDYQVDVFSNWKHCTLFFSS